MFTSLARWPSLFRTMYAGEGAPRIPIGYRSECSAETRLDLPAPRRAALSGRAPSGSWIDLHCEPSRRQDCIDAHPLDTYATFKPMPALPKAPSQRRVAYRCSLADQASAHVRIAASIAIGSEGMTHDGHVVRRLSSSQWSVRHVPRGSLYKVGQMIKGRVVFWRMNGLCARA